MFISFIISLALGVFIVVSDKLLGTTINPYAIQVFYGFLTLSGFTGTLTVYDKMKNKNKSENEDIPALFKQFLKNKINGDDNDDMDNYNIPNER